MKGRRLDRIITIQSPPEGRDALGNPTDEWGDYLPNIRARHIPAPGTEKYAAAATNAAYPSIFVIQDEARTRAITTQFRVLFDGRIYGIKGIEQPSRGAKIRITAVADE